jgi:hypothetical protein
LSITLSFLPASIALSRCLQVASIGINSHARVLNRLIARDQHTRCTTGEESSFSSVASQSVHGPAALHTPSHARFELRQSALRAPLSPPTQPVSISGIDVFDRSATNYSGQILGSDTSVPPTSPEKSTDFHGARMNLSANSRYNPSEAAQRTASSVLRAASSAAVSLLHSSDSTTSRLLPLIEPLLYLSLNQITYFCVCFRLGAAFSFAKKGRRNARSRKHIQRNPRHRSCGWRKPYSSRFRISRAGSAFQQKAASSVTRCGSRVAADAAFSRQLTLGGILKTNVYLHTKCECGDAFP